MLSEMSVPRAAAVAVVALGAAHFAWNDRSAAAAARRAAASVERTAAATARDEDSDVRQLRPPLLADENVLAYLPCARPARRDGVCLRAETLRHGARVVYHNYGHGGSGWALGVGCVQRSLAAFDAMGVPTSEPVAVVGAGTIGLFTVRGLLQRGYSDIHLFAESQEAELPSHKAAGHLGVFSAGLDAALVTAAALDSYRFWLRVKRGEEPDFPASCVRRVPRYAGSRDLVDDAAAHVAAGLALPPKQVRVRFGPPDAGRPVRTMWASDDNHTVDVLQAMARLNAIADGAGGRVTRHEGLLNNVEDDVPSRIRHVFNCAGVGARSLVGDTAVRPAGGHLVLLQGQPLEGAADYMLDLNAGPPTFVDARTGASLTREGARRLPASRVRTVEPYLYYLPKRGGADAAPGATVPHAHGYRGVLGGSVVHGMRSPDEPFRQEEFRRIVADARKFFYGDGSDDARFGIEV